MMKIFWIMFSFVTAQIMVWAQDVASKPEAKIEVKIDPKIDPKPELLEKLNKLKSNEACFLPAPTIIEEMGDFSKGWHYMKQFGPEGRDYTIKMAWMPDRERAFFCGANHQTPHRMNDAWEYDLAGNTWALLYVPDYNDVNYEDVQKYNAKLSVQDGFLRTPKGGPGHPAHTWWGLTYDPTIKAAVWYCAWPDYRLKLKLDQIGAKAEELYKGPPMWFFYTETKKWEPMKTEQPWPKTAKYSSSLEYVPDIKKSVFQYESSSFIFDPHKKKWKLMNDKGDPIPLETIVYYDIKRKTFVAHYGQSKNNDGSDSKASKLTFTAKLEGETITPWKKVLETDQAPIGLDSESMIYYDSMTGNGFLFELRTKSLWSYNPEINQWKKLSPKGDILTTANEGRIICYFDLSRNVFVALGKGWVWCYRP
jgi:hypothetical protein